MISTRSRPAPSAGVMILATLAVAWAARAQEGKGTPDRPPDGPKELREAWGRLFKAQATDYAIVVGEREATMLADPIMRWWQPVRGTDDGAIYLWVRDGRPQAAASIFTIKDGKGARDLVHECHSLSPDPVTARWRGEFAWECPGPGLVMAPVPGAPAPAESPAARLRQIQALAREFSARSLDRQGRPWELRLLTRPLYRYDLPRDESKSAAGVLDGAILAFAQGTDPEILLVLEASGRGADRAWKFAVAPFTDLGLRVLHRDREVYSCPVAVVLEGRHGPHVGFTVKKAVGDDPDAIDHR